MWVALWQALPDPDSSFTRNDKLVIIGMLAAVLTPTWLAWWNARVARKATQPNSGKSLADKLTRIETQNDRIETKVDVHTMALDTHREDLAIVKTGLADHRTEVARFIREFRRDLDDVRSDVHDLQQAQSQRRETVQQEEGTSQ